MIPTIETSAASRDPKRSFLRRQLFPTWAERKRTLRIEAWVLVIASYVLLVFAYVWPQDYRNQLLAYVLAAWAAFLVWVLVYQLGSVLTLVAIVAAFTRQRRLAAVAVPIALVTAGPTWWQYVPKTPPTVRGETITVMSVNLLMVNQHTDGIIGEIKAAQPDVLLLQEYSEQWHAAIQQALGAGYPHARCVVRDDSFGAAIYSRRPFAGDVQADLPLGSDFVPQMRAVIRLGDRDVTVYNIHLLPPRKLEYTIEMRSQFADLLDRLANEAQPVIVGGDFNFTERTPNAAALDKLGFVDAHSVGGQGRGTTWPVNAFFRWIPGLRFDHLYLGSGLTCTECRTGVGEGSDHRPIVATVGFRRQ